MKLPTIDVPTYDTTLPVSTLKIKYRPYLVKEEVIMLTANTSEDKNDNINAVTQVLNNCTFNKVDINKLSITDISWLLIKLREVSKGEIIDIGITCANVVDDEPCGKYIQTHANLKEIKVDDIKDTKEVKIQLSERLSIGLKYVGIKSMNAIFSSDLSDTDNMFDVMIDAIDYIYDSVDDKMYTHDEFVREDIIEFLEQLTTTQIEKIGEFLESVPKVKLDINFECPKCANKETITMDTLTDFLA